MAETSRKRMKTSNIDHLSDQEKLEVLRMLENEPEVFKILQK